jgi:alkylhydroperoxidase family enzyme
VLTELRGIRYFKGYAARFDDSIAHFEERRALILLQKAVFGKPHFEPAARFAAFGCRAGGQPKAALSAQQLSIK